MIRQNLGFGRVLECKNEWRFQVWDREGLVRLFCIFYGNIVLDKRHLQFEKWSTFIVFPPTFCIPNKSLFKAEKNKFSGTHLISLDNGWISGFWQADGGFYAWGPVVDFGRFP
jgi:hypothetical protein